MVDVCDALKWARTELPNIKLQGDVSIDGERVVVVGWSSGGQLAMSLAWTAPQRGLRPPEAILAFYCPTNYEDECKRAILLMISVALLTCRKGGDILFSQTARKTLETSMMFWKQFKTVP